MVSLDARKFAVAQRNVKWKVYSSGAEDFVGTDVGLATVQRILQYICEAFGLRSKLIKEPPFISPAAQRMPPNNDSSLGRRECEPNAVLAGELNAS
jgi:hypothetical protein